MLSIGYTEILVLGVVAVILFGRKLPEVARNVGQSYAQFRKGLADLQSTIEIDDSDLSSTESNAEFEYTYEDVPVPSGPQFEPPKIESDEKAG